MSGCASRPNARAPKGLLVRDFLPSARRHEAGSSLLDCDESPGGTVSKKTPRVPSPPAPTIKERLESGAGAVISAAVSFAAQVPVGPLAAEIYRQTIGSGFDRRGREFMEELAGVVSELVEHFDRLPEELSKDDKFLDAVARASVTAMRDHRPQKREMLRNALLNSAQPSSFDEDIQQILFRFIDELTLTH
jgi:hypothetical protein